MNKSEFLQELEKNLQALPEKERKDSLEYYCEMIDDRMDDGMTEHEAVAACGNIPEIVDKIIVDTPLTKLVKQKNKSRRRMQGWEILLLVLGFPVWFSLLVAAFCVLLAISVALWAVAISVFAVFVALGASAVGVSVLAVIYLVQGQFLPALFCFGCVLIFAGLTLLFFLLGKLCGKGVAKLHKLTFRGIKRCFIRKEKKS